MKWTIVSVMLFIHSFIWLFICLYVCFNLAPGTVAIFRHSRFLIMMMMIELNCIHWHMKSISATDHCNLDNWLKKKRALTLLLSIRNPTQMMPDAFKREKDSFCSLFIDFRNGKSKRRWKKVKVFLVNAVRRQYMCSKMAFKIVWKLCTQAQAPAYLYGHAVFCFIYLINSLPLKEFAMGRCLSISTAWSVCGVLVYR